MWDLLQVLVVALAADARSTAARSNAFPVLILQVPLYERGYEKDPAKVAAEAIRVAERDGRDVVLVDTAGRMQVGDEADPLYCREDC